MWRSPASWFTRRSLRQPRRPALAAALLALAVLPALACLAPHRAAAQVPRFLIETITVEGVKSRGARQIVVSQSYLKTGQSYTESELQEAVYRVKRLPFVVEADVALRKGTVRGSYELVVTVEETRPLFIEVAPTAVYQALTPGRPVVIGAGTLQWTSEETVALRQFVGAAGFAFESVGLDNGFTGSDKTLSAGYTQYNLFGNGSYATLEGSELYDPHVGPSPTVSAVVGIPLTANLALVITPQWMRNSFGGGQYSASIGGSLGLIYRTTDDPIIPTRGADIEATFNAESTTERFFLGSDALRGTLESQGLNLVATRYWPVTARQSLGVSGEAFGGRVTSSPALQAFFADSDKSAVLELLYSASLWDSAATRRFGDLRFEASVGDSVTHSNQPIFPLGTATVFQPVVDVGAVYRNEWGLLRLTFTYLGRETP